MPANLTQQYLKAEQQYRQAATPEDELRCLETMLRELPKHKGTDKLQAELKQKISRAKKDIQSATKGGKRPGLRIPRQGAGRAVLIGGPNAGKSRLIRALTRAEPLVAPYPFSTHEPAPAMMPWQDVMVQLIDTPPITREMLDPNLQGLIRGAELAVLVVDLGADEGIEQVREVVERLGGTKTRLARSSFLDESDVGVSHTQTIVALNKMDEPQAAERLELLNEFCPLDFETHRISAEQGEGLEALREAIFRAMDVVRVYTKEPTMKEPDFEKPFTIRRGGTLIEVAELIHKDLAKSFRHARVWGSEVHDGTTVKADYVVHDRDIVELHV